MSMTVLQTPPANISPEVVGGLLENIRSQEIPLQAIIHRFEQRYNVALDAFEARLARGEGPEHPDWEDSIEWRKAIEALQRTQVMRNLLEWLLHSMTPSPIS